MFAQSPDIDPDNRQQVNGSGVIANITRLSYVCNPCPYAQHKKWLSVYLALEYNSRPVADIFTSGLTENPRTPRRASLTEEILLTMYKPNFCSDCGSRIERASWHLWTSRRFCPDCAPRFRRTQFLLPVIAGATLFCIGLAAGRAARSLPPPLIVERGQLAAVSAPSTTGEERADGATTKMNMASVPKAEPAYGPDGTATERPTDLNETVSLCGARTQKGTPCQRRVRGTGRCWQHKGMPAIIRNTVIN
jgi:hypothetical protein